MQLLTEGVYQHYGFDFRDYSYPSLRRRILKRVYAEGLSTIAGLTEKVLRADYEMLQPPGFQASPQPRGSSNFPKPYLAVLAWKHGLPRWFREQLQKQAIQVYFLPGPRF